jgi:hypothetical protein
LLDLDPVNRAPPAGFEYNSLVTKDQILSELRRLRRNEQVEVLERLAEVVAAPLSQEEERGLVEAIDETEQGELVDGPAVFDAIHARRTGK